MQEQIIVLEKENKEREIQIKEYEMKLKEMENELLLSLNNEDEKRIIAENNQKNYLAKVLFTY